MPNPSRSFAIPAFQPIDSLAETTQLGAKLLQLRNGMLRPQGGFKGGPKYDRLWAIGSASTIYATIAALPGMPADNTAKTVALRVARQGKNFLLFYNLPARECRGFFYMGDDGTYTSGAYDFTAGSPTWEILGTGYDNTARWYGTRFFTAIYLGNGVDDNIIAQLSRTATPGKWRKAGSNAAPSAPVLSLAQPATTTNVQAFWDVSGRTGGVTLTFTARQALFPGLSGNNKIKVRIAQSGAGQAIYSRLSGQGTTADPYFYTLTAGTAAAQSSNNAIVSFVNADSKAITILKASTASPEGTADLGDYGPTDLAGGSGSGVSTGFTNRTVTFYSRYWDPGTDLLGYEGISSPISNEVIITSTSNNDIRVLVPVDSTAEGGRFPFIRLYMQYAEEPEAVWLLVNPDNPVPNGLTGTFTRYGSTNEIVLASSAWSAGDKLRVSTTGSLPGGLTAGTDYYLQAGTATGRWYLALTADGTPVTLSSNGTGVQTATLYAKSVQIGTNTPIRTAADGGEMFEDQYRPLAHKHHAMASEQVYRGAVTQYPARLYPSKPATFDELAPEGCSLDELSVVDLQTTTGAPGSTDITALVSTESRLDIHTRGGLIILDTSDPTDPTSQYSPQSGAGCVNGTSFALIEGKALYYLGADLQLRTMSASRIGNDFASMVAQTDFVARAANAYLRDRVDIDALARTPQRGCLFIDRQSQHLWFTLPVLGGALNMFGFDLANNGIVGPFDYPRVYAQAPMESERAEMVFADESGNLFVWDTANQDDSGDAFSTSSAFTPHSPSDPVPVQYAGYGYVDLDGVRYYQANTTVLETGFIDLAGADMRKALIALLWRTVKNSRAILSVTVTTLNQDTETLSFSETEFYAEVEHRLNCLLGSTTSFKLTFNVTGAEQQPWIIRDITALWKLQGKV